MCRTTSKGVSEATRVDDDGQPLIGEKWQKVAGKRYARLTRCLDSRMFNFTILLISIVIEPLENLTRLFMRLSVQAPDHGKMSPIMDLNYPEASWLTCVLQIYSAMAAGSGKCPRVFGYHESLKWH